MANRKQVSFSAYSDCFLLIHSGPRLALLYGDNLFQNTPL